jgi:hypothetical protein
MKYMNTRLLSPGKRARLQLKKRLEAIKPLMPTNWKVLYLYEYPEDRGQEVFLSTVMAGTSLHEPTIKKLEDLLCILKEKGLAKTI